jgi:hypothetical protein
MNQILDKVELSKEILTRLGVKFNPNKLKQNISCWNHKDTNPSLSINLELSVYYCFSCGDHGSLRHKYYEVFHRDIYKDLNLSTNEINLLTPTKVESESNFENIPETDLDFEGKLYPISITEAGKIWLKHRGFTEKDLLRIKAKYCQFGIFKQASNPNNKNEWIYCLNRIVIPIFENGKCISYELRDIMGETHYKKQLEKKKLLLSEHPYKKLLYPKHSSVNTLFELNRLSIEEPLYLVEGLMDLISLRTHSAFKNSTCLFHCIPTERQYYLLRNFKKIVYIINNDLPGAMGCKKLMERNPNTYFLCPPDTVNDVSDILQKKDKRFNNLDDLVTNWNWLSYIKSSKRDIDLRIKKYSEV